MVNMDDIRAAHSQGLPVFTVAHPPPSHSTLHGLMRTYILLGWCPRQRHICNKNGSHKSCTLVRSSQLSSVSNSSVWGSGQGSQHVVTAVTALDNVLTLLACLAAALKSSSKLSGFFGVGLRAVVPLPVALQAIQEEDGTESK